MKGRIAEGDWIGRLERFADYWLGDGAWSAMPERRRAAFVESLPPNVYEWQAVMDEQTPIEGYAAVTAPHARRERPRDAPPHPRDRRDPRAGCPQLVVPLTCPRAATWRR